MVLNKYKYTLLYYIEMDIPFIPFFCLSLIYGLFSFVSFILIGINSNTMNTCTCCNNIWYNLLGDAILKLICCFAFMIFGYSAFKRLSNKSLSTDINLIFLVLASIATDGLNLSLRDKCLPENKDSCYTVWTLSALNIGLLYYFKIPTIIITLLSKIIYYCKCKKYKFYYLLNNETSENSLPNINRDVANAMRIMTTTESKGDIELLQV